MLQLFQSQRELESIQIQRDEMKKNIGMMFKPKQIMHFDNPWEEGRTFIIFKLCGYYNERFHCIDVDVTSCKYTFHPFCLVVMLKHSNECCIYNVKLHLNWWTSWHFENLLKAWLNLQIKWNLSKLEMTKY